MRHFPQFGKFDKNLTNLAKTLTHFFKKGKMKQY